jgi:hypothetical protein
LIPNTDAKLLPSGNSFQSLSLTMNFGFWFLVFGLKKIGVDAHPFLGDLNSLNPKSQISKPRSY